ncbi:hypothetical protein NBO_6g0103 [Nosema bombycis CQ1]|uniref:Uncharacterized protein n=1 Tax=Nosema bombycis (strain CQ1 / CVCC 102059) TaxID=578461 RepID=R0MR45_NOSB1|nr:hypothetical protein NBO_6g0103 [Nosema bombycis CQ1]|eukprot:EOB15353.1 hypothetical protein NBO_6g0103 [Nosema bombycis CQ1]
MDSKIEDIIQSKISEKDCKIIFYYGKIVDRHKENRISLESLGPVVLNTLPPFYKFKRFTNEIFYNQAISKMKTSIRSSDSLLVYYDGSNSVDDFRDPFTTLFVHLPSKKCDLMIKCFNSKKKEIKSPIFEELQREIIECKTSQWNLRCIKSKNKSEILLYEVNVEVKDVFCIKSLLFDLFDDVFCKKKQEDDREDPWI